MAEASKALTREAILGAQDLITEAVKVPEWGGVVYVRAMTGAERDAFEQSIFKGAGADRRENFANMRARLVALTAVDEHGDRLFSEADAEALGAKSAAALDRVFGVARRLNGLRSEDVEELAKN